MLNRGNPDTFPPSARGRVIGGIVFEFAARGYMFSRSPPPDPKSLLSDVKSLESPRAMPPSVPAPSSFSLPVNKATGAGFSMGSLIGNDLTIVGQGLKIITRGTLQVDGKVDGDVIGNEVIVGEKGHVTGTVSAETVIVRGHVSGAIRGLTVALMSGSHVEGDVHHRELSVEQGAHLDGRVRRPKDPNDLKPKFDVDIAKS